MFTLCQKQEHFLTLTFFNHLQVRAFQIQRLCNYHCTSPLNASNPILNSLKCSNSFTTSCDNKFNYLIICCCEGASFVLNLLPNNCFWQLSSSLCTVRNCEQIINRPPSPVCSWFFKIANLFLSRLGCVPFSSWSALVFFVWKPFAISDHSFFYVPFVLMLLFFLFEMWLELFWTFGHNMLIIYVVLNSFLLILNIFAFWAAAECCIQRTIRNESDVFPDW